MKGGYGLPKPNPEDITQPLLPAFSRTLTDAVVFALDVNRSAGLPLQTFNGKHAAMRKHAKMHEHEVMHYHAAMR
jgi:hypothetical protein